MPRPRQSAKKRNLFLTAINLTRWVERVNTEYFPEACSFFHIEGIEYEPVTPISETFHQPNANCHGSVIGCISKMPFKKDFKSD